jgi:hypothetical protein
MDWDFEECVMDFHRYKFEMTIEILKKIERWRVQDDEGYQAVFDPALRSADLPVGRWIENLISGPSRPLCLSSFWPSEQAETDVVEPKRRSKVAPMSGARVRGGRIPAATANHTVGAASRARWIITRR